MAYPNGFTYVSGPIAGRVLSTISSTATFRSNNPVTLSDDRTLIEADSDTTAIFGIALADAANSIAGALSGKCLVEIPTPQTVYAVKIQTGVAGSVISVGQSYGIEKSGNHMRLDTDSQATPMVTILGRQDGTVIDSADSSIHVTWLGNVLGVGGSNASVNIFAQN